MILFVVDLGRTVSSLANQHVPLSASYMWANLINYKNGEITPEPQASGRAGETTPRLASLWELERDRDRENALFTGMRPVAEAPTSSRAGDRVHCLLKSSWGLTSAGKAASPGGYTSTVPSGHSSPVQTKWGNTLHLLVDVGSGTLCY